MYSERILKRGFKGHLIFTNKSSVVKQYVTGTCTLFSDGRSQISASFVPSIRFRKALGFAMSTLNLKDFDIGLVGRTTKGEEILATQLLIDGMSRKNRIGKTVRFKPTFSNCKTVSLKKGSLQGNVEVRYILNNFDIGKIRNDRSFSHGKLKFDVVPYQSYRDTLQKLKKFRGVFPTAMLLCDKGKLSEKYLDTIAQKAFDFFSFAKATHISCVLTEIVDDSNNYELKFTGTYAMSYNYGNDVLDFDGHKMKDLLEPGFKKYGRIKKKYNVLHLLQIYLDAQSPFFADNKAALMSILFEALKNNYKKNCIRKGQRTKVQFKKKGKWRDMSFREILIQLFKDEKFKFYKKELTFIERVRNPTIHEGKFKSFKRDYPIFYSQVHLFQRFVLHLIGYKGSYEKWSLSGPQMIIMK